MTTMLKDQYEDHEIIPSGMPDVQEQRAAALQLRQQAAARIPQIHKEFTPKIDKAERGVIDADRHVKAAEDVLRIAKATYREAVAQHGSLVHQRDNAIGTQERIIRDNPDVELRSLIWRLDEGMTRLKNESSGSRRWKSRAVKIENAIKKAHELERDGGIINMAKLELALAAVWASGGIN